MVIHENVFFRTRSPIVINVGELSSGEPRAMKRPRFEGKEEDGGKLSPIGIKCSPTSPNYSPASPNYSPTSSNRDNDGIDSDIPRYGCRTKAGRERARKRRGCEWPDNKKACPVECHYISHEEEDTYPDVTCDCRCWICAPEDYGPEPTWVKQKTDCPCWGSIDVAEKIEMKRACPVRPDECRCCCYFCHPFTVASLETIESWKSTDEFISQHRNWVNEPYTYGCRLGWCPGRDDILPREVRSHALIHFKAAQFLTKIEAAVEDLEFWIQHAVDGFPHDEKEKKTKAKEHGEEEERGGSGKRKSSSFEEEFSSYQSRVAQVVDIRSTEFQNLQRQLWLTRIRREHCDRVGCCITQFDCCENSVKKWRPVSRLDELPIITCPTMETMSEWKKNLPRAREAISNLRNHVVENSDSSELERLMALSSKITGAQEAIVKVAKAAKAVVKSDTKATVAPAATVATATSATAATEAGVEVIS